MPLFGFRKDKKHEQSHVQAKAGLAKKSASAKKDKTVRTFNSDKPEKVSARVVTKDEGAAKSGAAMPEGRFSSAAAVIIRPRITEKSGILSQSGVYTFEVAAGTNKPSIARAIAGMYKVTPVKVAIMNGPAKRIFVRGRRGKIPGVRKAIVTVKKGEKIDFI